ncbi:MAG: UDP-N-acetylglucosamine 2-epimerase (non-hydrolyzing) [Nitrospira sp.]|nr:MAG: UDP-N-acetylglucosamine 2-epimerase (non-hydrolyzing) [Nitrospira sp.]
MSVPTESDTARGARSESSSALCARTPATCATIVCVVGARPNFMKAAPVLQALGTRPHVCARLIHTGQHYDRLMSELFFEELGLVRPLRDLGVGTATPAEQIGQIMLKLGPVLQQERPDLVMVFGDVTSTVAAALCAASAGVKVAHVEAGLRSFDRTMPEELNRVVTDHVADFLFVTEPSGVENLMREGIAADKVFFVGNVMVDSLLKHVGRARQLQHWTHFGLHPQEYAVVTLHRPSNVDDTEVLTKILETLEALSRETPILFPCHPRTRLRLVPTRFRSLLKEFADDSTQMSNRLMLVDPLGYLEFLSVMSEARLVLTDSGGIQEETTVLGIPCLTLRHNTERPITISRGTNRLVGTDPEHILAAARCALKNGHQTGLLPDLWDGNAAERIGRTLDECLTKL